MLPDRKDERLAARLEDLGYGYTDGITAAVRKSPERNQKDETEKKPATSCYQARLARQA
jgi:hypothetical protein